MQLKGAVIRSLLAAVEKLHGADGLAAVMNAVAKDVRAAIEPRVLPIQWYPVEIVAELQVAIRATIGRGSWELAHALGVEAAKADFSSIYKSAFLRAVQYDSVLDGLERAWAIYNSQGKVTWADRTPGHATGIITGTRGYNAGMWHGVAGRVEGLLLVTGARSVAAELHDPTPTSARIDCMWLT